MADSDKNILITPQTGNANADPTIVFTGGSNNPVTLTVEDDGSLNFSSSIGDLFNITNSLSGIVFSANDANNVPIIEVDSNGTIYLNEFKGNTLIGTGTDDGVNKLQVEGSVSLKDDLLVTANTPIVDYSAKFVNEGVGGFNFWIESNHSSIADFDFIGYDNGGSLMAYGRIQQRGFNSLAGSEYGIMDFVVAHQKFDTTVLSLTGLGAIKPQVQVRGNADLYLYANSSIVFEGATDDGWETTLTVINPSTDRTISLPDNSGTVAVAGASTTTTTQGALNTGVGINLSGQLSVSGTAYNLSTTSQPTFLDLNLTDTIDSPELTFAHNMTNANLPVVGTRTGEILFYGSGTSGGFIGGQALYSHIRGTITDPVVANPWTGGLEFVVRDDTGVNNPAVTLNGKNKTVNILNGYTLVTDSKKMDAINNNKIVTYTVTVQGKTADHIFFGQGSSNGYAIDGIEGPHISFIPNVTYQFDQSDSTNTNHPLGFYLDAAKSLGYTTNFTYVGTAGSPGAYAELIVTDSTPSKLYYQCGVHSYMGSSVSVVNHNLSGFTTDDLIEGTTNKYFSDSLAQGAFSQGTGVTISSGTISIGQAVATSSIVTFQSVATNGSITVNNGSGRKLTAPVLDLTGVDTVITLNSDLGGVAPTSNVAIVVNRGSSTDSYIEWDESNDVWVVGDGTTRSNILTSSTTGLDADTLDGQDGTHYLDYTNFTNTPTSLLDFNISDGNAGQVLQTDGNGNFSFTTVTGGGGGGGSGFVAVEVYNFTSSGSSTFGTATNKWLYFQPFVNGSLVDDSNFTANSQTGIVTITPAPTTGADVTIYTYNSSVLENVDLLSVANTGDLTITGDIYGTNADFSGYVNYGIAQQGTASFNVTATPANPTFTYTSNNYKGVKLLIHVRDNTSAEEQIQEALILTNGALPQITSYANIYTGSQPIMDFDVSFSSGTTSLVMTRSNTNTMTVKIQYTMIES